jgi:hypothetical protein
MQSTIKTTRRPVVNTQVFFPAILLSLLFATACVAQQRMDILHLKDGTKVVGTIAGQIPDKSVPIRTRNGNEASFSFDRIEKIPAEYDEDSLRDLRSRTYPELGITFGMPSILNFACGIWSGPVGLRISGMYWGRGFSGFQGNLGFKPNDTDEPAITLLGGLVHTDDSFLGHHSYTFVGLGLEYNLHGFFLQLGVMYMQKVSGTWNSVLPTGQIGYVYRFLPD